MLKIAITFIIMTIMVIMMHHHRISQPTVTPWSQTAGHSNCAVMQWDYYLPPHPPIHPSIYPLLDDDDNDVKDIAVCFG